MSQLLPVKLVTSALMCYFYLIFSSKQNCLSLLSQISSNLHKSCSKNYFPFSSSPCCSPGLPNSLSQQIHKCHQTPQSADLYSTLLNHATRGSQNNWAWWFVLGDVENHHSLSYTVYVWICMLVRDNRDEHVKIIFHGTKQTLFIPRVQKNSLCRSHYVRLCENTQPRINHYPTAYTTQVEDETRSSSETKHAS